MPGPRKDDHDVSYETPKAFFDVLDAEFHFDLDACASEENAKCRPFFSLADNALTKSWDGTVWCNPPYIHNQLGDWVKKCRISAERGATVVCLVPAYTDTSWWHAHAAFADEIRWVKGRLRFGGSAGRAMFPSVVLVFRPPARQWGPRFSSIDSGTNRKAKR